jgi:hypothetical protein
MMHDSVHQLQSSWNRALHALAGLQTSLLIHQIRNADPDPPH